MFAADFLQTLLALKTTVITNYFSLQKLPNNYMGVKEYQIDYIIHIFFYIYFIYFILNVWCYFPLQQIDCKCGN